MAADRQVARLEEFLAERGEPLLHAAILLTGSREAGEDLLQTALERTWRGGLGPQPVRVLNAHLLVWRVPRLVRRKEFDLPKGFVSQAPPLHQLRAVDPGTRRPWRDAARNSRHHRTAGANRAGRHPDDRTQATRRQRYEAGAAARIRGAQPVVRRR
jgi:hypothetical protein